MCSKIKNRTYAKSVGTSTIFSTYDGVDPYAEMTNWIFPFWAGGGPDESLVEDNIDWVINLREHIPFTDTTLYGPEGEAEWDIRVVVPFDANLEDYSVIMKIDDINFYEGYCRIGLSTGDGFIKINGGLDFVTLSGESFNGEPLLKLIPDVPPTSSEAANMKVAIHMIETNFSSFPSNIEAANRLEFYIDAVYVNLNYTEPCDRCQQPPLNCNADETAAQQTSLIYIKNHQLPLSQIPVPTNLYRVKLCNGDETYLLQHELDMLVGDYLILQQVGISSRTETHLTNIQAGPGNQLPDPLPPPRDDLFALKLEYYNNDRRINPDLQGYKNGNIATMYWQVGGSDRMAYAFRYDKLDRLKNAFFANIDKNDNYYNHFLYDVEVDYDKIGNIDHLIRQGVTGECDENGTFNYRYGEIDNLNYGYDAQRERLMAITDQSAHEKGFRSTDAGHAYAYEYDLNGNITYDESKAAHIFYNHLNLPWKVQAPGGVVKYIYDATGVKWEKRSTADDGNSIIYINGYEKYGGGDRFVNHAEGRYAEYHVENEDPIWRTEYSLRDHLGNSRVMISDLNEDGAIQISPQDLLFNGQAFVAPEIIQQEHYYPFGMTMDGDWRDDYWQPANAILYNSKELDKDLGLNWYHYGARYYDPAVGRFTGVDPLAPKYSFQTPYAYAANNPLRFIDFMGLGPGDPPTKRTVIKQTFRFDKTPNGARKGTGTDVLTRTEVNVSQGESGEVRTTVVTRLSVDSDGGVSENATQFAMTESGTGENREFAMTATNEISSSKVDQDLQDAAQSVSTYKNDNGESPLQAKADNINKNIGYGASAVAAVATQGASLTVQVEASVGAGAVANEVVKISPESLSITIKDEKEEIK